MKYRVTHLKKDLAIWRKMEKNMQKKFCQFLGTNSIFETHFSSYQIISTVWKMQNFSVTQILREIKIEALNFDFNEFLTFLQTDIYHIDKIQSH